MFKSCKSAGLPAVNDVSVGVNVECFGLLGNNGETCTYVRSGFCSVSTSVVAILLFIVMVFSKHVIVYCSGDVHQRLSSCLFPVHRSW